MTDMVKTQKMQNHAVPVPVFELCWYVSCHVVVYLGKVLAQRFSVLLKANIQVGDEKPLTETKKLEVPSARKNVLGNSLSHVSSPYITNLPPGLSFN